MSASHFEILLRDARVLDGTGNPAYAASIGIADGRMYLVRDRSESNTAQRIIDGRGLVAAPGFIDMHSHSGLMILTDPLHESKVTQGVTTEVIGVDGNSYAPFLSTSDLDDFVAFNAGLDGRPDIDYNWHRVEEYLGRFDGNAAVNIVLMVGNSALRICAEGWDDTPCSARTLRTMQSMLAEAMAEGAHGISSGLDYPPGSYASTNELTALAATAAEHGGFYHTHMRYQLGDGFLDPIREAVQIGREGSCPVHITHLYRRTNAPGGARALLGEVETAREDGLDVTFDAYPYPWNSTRMTILLPMDVQQGGPEALLRRLDDPKVREDLRAEVDARAVRYGGSHVWTRIRLGNFTQAANASYEGQTIASIAAMRDQHPSEVICDLLVSENLGVNQVAASPDPATLPEFVDHDLAMIGSDSVFLGDLPSPRTYGTFPYILQRHVREERVLRLEEAVRKMTSFPAARLGLTDRGAIRDGAYADLVVFDPNAVGSNATYDDPCITALGIEYVVVNGELVIDKGAHTGRTPGRSVRR